MTSSSSGLAVVQDLYLLQVELYRFLQSDLADPAERREARQKVKMFASLLSEADWQYMGGEDVFEDLMTMQRDVSEKIGATSGRKLRTTQTPTHVSPKSVEKSKSVKKVTVKKSQKTEKKLAKKK